jgi:hypothetical protein
MPPVPKTIIRDVSFSPPANPGPAVEWRAWHQAKLWFDAVEMQHERLLAAASSGNPSGPIEFDVRLYAYSLNNLRRAIIFTRDHVPGGDCLNDALKEFDTRVPDVVKTRDLIEHFDDWLRGQGRRQQPGEGYVLGVGLSMVDSASGMTPQDVSFGHAGEGVQIAIATPAARELFAATEKLLRPLTTG